MPPVGPHVDGRDAPLGVERHAGVQILAARLGVGQEGFAPAGDPAHRPAERPRRKRHDDEFGIDQVARAEAAAGIRHDHPQVVAPNAQAIGDDRAQDVAGLAAGMEREPAVGIFGERAARLHEGGGRAGERDILPDDPVRRREGRIGRGPVARRPDDRAVVGRVLPDRRCIVGQRILRRAQRRQGIVIDLDQFRRFQGGRLGFGDDEGDGFAGEAHPALGQRILRGIDDGAMQFAVRQRLVRAGRQGAHAGRAQVRRRIDRQHARNGQRRRRVDFAEHGVGMGRAHEGGMGLAGPAEIGGERAGPGEKRAVLHARYRGADEGDFFCCGFRCRHRAGFRVGDGLATVAFLARPTARTAVLHGIPCGARPAAG